MFPTKAFTCHVFRLTSFLNDQRYSQLKTATSWVSACTEYIGLCVYEFLSARKYVNKIYVYINHVHILRPAGTLIRDPFYQSVTHFIIPWPVLSIRDSFYQSETCFIILLVFDEFLAHYTKSYCIIIPL